MQKNLNRVIIFGILFVVGSCAALICYEEDYATSYQVFHKISSFKSYVAGPLLKGESIRGEIVAADNNLGIVKLRINTYNRQNTDTIHFRIRQTGSHEWLVDNTISVALVSDGLLYPFGFPAIADSRDKTYEFQVLSEKGEHGNAVGIMNGFQAIASEYVYSKSVLIHDKVAGLKFIYRKSLSLFSDIYFILFYSIFVLPPVLYLFKERFTNNYRRRLVYILCLLYALSVYSYIPIQTSSNTILWYLIYFQTIFYLVYPSAVFAMYVYGLGILFIFQMIVAAAMGKELASTKLAIDVFYLFVLSTIATVVDLMR